LHILKTESDRCGLVDSVTYFKPTNGKHNHTLFLILWCSSYMFRPLYAIIREVVYKGIY